MLTDHPYGQDVRRPQLKAMLGFVRDGGRREVQRTSDIR
jgi:hypothetical protein